MMTDPIYIEQVGKRYRIFKQGKQINTPGGNPYETEHHNLAQLVCEDINHLGPDPRGQRPSYVSLHAGYCDFGRSVPKSELIQNIFMGYDPEWDIALAASDAFEELSGSPTSLFSGESGFAIDPIIFFGPPEQASTINQWLKILSRRALISVQTIGGNYQSILCSYRLLNGDPFMPNDSMVHGLVQYGSQYQIDPYLTADVDALQIKIVELFKKAKIYASFPDD